MTTDFTPADHVAVTWERFTKLFRDEYVPKVERERLEQEFLSLKQKTESVIEITSGGMSSPPSKLHPFFANKT